MANPQAVRLFEQIYAKVDKQVRDIVTSMLPNVSVAAQDDGSVIANDHRILNFQGPGVVVTDDSARRRVNVFVPGSPASSSSTTFSSTAGLEKVYTLASGSLSGAPANWYTVGFSDAAWANSVAMTTDITTAYQLVPGTTWVSNVAGDVTTPAGCLVRRSFTLPAGSITSASLQINVDDEFGPIGVTGSLYLNGVNIVSRFTRPPIAPGPYVTIALSPSELITGGTNVLALHVYDFHTGTFLQPHSVSYKLTVNLSEGGADTRYQVVSEKNQANGYAGLDSGTRVPTARLGSGTADNTTYLRGDQIWATPSGSGGGGGVTPSLLVTGALVASDISGGSISTGTWTNIGTTVSFTPTTANVVVRLSVRGLIAAVTSSSAGRLASALIIDGATRYLMGGTHTDVGSGRNVLAGAGELVVTNLSAASHTAQLQLYCDLAAVTIYCRPSALPNLEHCTLQVVQY